MKETEKEGGLDFCEITASREMDPLPFPRILALCNPV